MESLSDIPLRRILNDISYEDLMNLLKVPNLRNTVLSFYQDEINFRELEKKIMMDCIDDLETNLQTNLFFELLSYFESKSYKDVRTFPEFEMFQKQFYDEVFHLDLDDPTRQAILQIQEMEGEISDVKRMLKKKKLWNPVLDQVSDKYQNKIDRLENIEMERFKKVFFKGPSSYQNIKEYVEKLKDYVDLYLQSDEEQMIKDEFLLCVGTKLENVHRIFIQI
jgi:hypothetical protein